MWRKQFNAGVFGGQEQVIHRDWGSYPQGKSA
jgi:hypothetical protein